MTESSDEQEDEDEEEEEESGGHTKIENDADSTNQIHDANFPTPPTSDHNEDDNRN